MSKKKKEPVEEPLIVIVPNPKGLSSSKAARNTSDLPGLALFRIALLVCLIVLTIIVLRSVPTIWNVMRESILSLPNKWSTWIASEEPALNQIAFVSNRDGNYEIYVMNEYGGQTRLTNDHGKDEEPVWSPDGTRIAFTSDRNGNRDIYVMNADGSDLRQLTNNPFDEGQTTWSPHGTQIAYAGGSENDLDIYVMNADGSGQIKITDSCNARFPAWSPDNKYISYLSGCTPGGIVIIHPDGSNEATLTFHQLEVQGISAPIWSPDGQRIAYTVEPSGMNSNYELRVIDLLNLTSEPPPYSTLTFSYAPLFGPAWSPDGNQIAFSSGDFGSVEIYKVNTRGIDVEQAQLTYDSIRSGNAAFSPDGTQIAFASERDGNFEIYTVMANGSGLTRLTHNTSLDFSPVWAPQRAR